MMPASPPNRSRSIERFQTRQESISATITKAKPRIYAISRYSSGSSGVCQTGWTRGPARISRDPSEDWCIEGSTKASAIPNG